MARLPIALFAAAWGVMTCGQHAFLQVVSQAKSVPIDWGAITLTYRMII
jgi:hypothetical protein